MKASRKIFILVPDGVGLRNFAYSDFRAVADRLDAELVYWNNTTFDLSTLGLKEIKVPASRIHWYTDLLKSVKIDVYLDQFTSRFKDSIYQRYKFKPPASQLKNPKRLTQYLMRWLLSVKFKGSNSVRLQDELEARERKSAYYLACYAQLKAEQPAFVFSTNQRPIVSLAPILAARDLGIPTGTFIFSWDNLPKATMVLRTDYYFVWSDYMKAELLKYYCDIEASQVIVAGTPQFEPYKEASNVIPREDFYQRYGLQNGLRYICYSGDDITTSPYDPFYLRDIAESVSLHNDRLSSKWGIIFRRCPVDKSDRYDWVINQFRDVIFPVDPDWQASGEGWNEIMPLPGDTKLLVSTVYYSELVVNIGSSMVFDFVNFGKPCCYLNYDVDENDKSKWSIEYIYRFVHFRSMPSPKAVTWINSKNDLITKLAAILDQPGSTDLSETYKWYETINHHPDDRASERILKSILNIMGGMQQHDSSTPQLSLANS